MTHTPTPTDRNGYPKVYFKATNIEGRSVAQIAPGHTTIRTEGFNRMIGGANYRFQCSCGFDQEVNGKSNRPAQAHVVEVLGLVWSPAERCFVSQEGA